MSKTKKIISVVLAAVLVMAMTTVAIVSFNALEDGAMHVVAGVPELCGAGNTGTGWDPSDTANQMTFNADKGIYEKVYENVAAGEYAFKVTTGGAWDNGDFNLEGDAMYGGANAVATVTVDGSTVIIGFDGTKALLDIIEPATQETTAAPVETTAAPVETTAAPVETTVAEPVETTAAPVETTVAEPVETTAAPVETTVAEPVETTAAPVETTVAEPVETTAAPVETTAAPAEGNGVVVDGKEYDVTVGEEIVYTATLKTPALIEDVQGFVSYDAAKLTVVDCVAPNLGDSAIINTELAGTVYFNASVVKGIDFTTEATLVEIKFAVVDDTYSEIALTIEEMTEKDGDSYFTDSEQKNDAVVVTESLFVQEETTAPTTVAPTTVAPTTEATTATAEATTATAEATTVVVVPTDVKGTTSTTPNQGGNDTPPTGSTVAIFAVLAVLTMAAGAVVVLRKKING